MFIPNADPVLLAALKRTITHLKSEIFEQGLKRKPLVFGFENSKIKGAYTFSLPSGYTCPQAHKCLAKADRFTGKLTNGEDQEYRCFSASQEAVYPSVRKLRWHNFERLREAGNTASMVKLILESLPANAQRVRLQVSGDFFSQAYFDAWLEVARSRPNTIFYAYTKSISFWLNRLDQIPTNFKLNASIGGKQDDLIQAHNLKSARVVLSEAEADQLHLEIDKDDSHAWAQDNSFALLVHGTQKPGSAASKAWSMQLKKLRTKDVNKVKKNKTIPTLASLTMRIVLLSKRLANILSMPEYRVEKVG